MESEFQTVLYKVESIASDENDCVRICTSTQERKCGIADVLTYSSKP